MQTQELFAHPAHPPLAVRSITATLDAREANWLRLRWRIEGASAVHVPPFAGARRRDGLWQTTCFEMFAMPVADDREAYTEFNFSPSEAWAAYDFAAYRSGGQDRTMARPPIVSWRGGGSLAIVDVALPLAALPACPFRYAITAVIEEDGGRKSFWAPCHPADRPDFHDAACFVNTLAAPDIA